MISEKILIDYPESQCDCETCVNMCHNRPCWGTPDDIEIITEVGLGKFLMLDWVIPNPEKPTPQDDIFILTPATKGNQGKRAPLFPCGTCVFLTNDQKCLLHDYQLKPTEGKRSKHDSKDGYPLHMAVAMEWDSDKGRELVKQWEAKHL